MSIAHLSTIKLIESIQNTGLWLVFACTNMPRRSLSCHLLLPTHAIKTCTSLVNFYQGKETLHWKALVGTQLSQPLLILSLFQQTSHVLFTLTGMLTEIRKWRYAMCACVYVWRHQNENGIPGVFRKFKIAARLAKVAHRFYVNNFSLFLSLMGT